ncbi:hypothetical protein RhiJN_13126 [Ceratobasidium sp. AG-Ba]|nr:hypothetical protein RhiJN_08760 [Ceratobasidium sp. AG-Ba]QRV85108.1 hypothetical protein RhiJN_13126 [Ceratobasidium sp. AG-Ba]
MAVFTSDPVFDKELASNTQPTLLAEPNEEEIEPLFDNVDNDDDLDPKVEDIHALIMGARSVDDTTQPATTTNKLDHEQVQHEGATPAPSPAPVINSTSTRSRRTTRPSIRCSSAH